MGKILVFAAVLITLLLVISPCFIGGLDEVRPDGGILSELFVGNLRLIESGNAEAKTKINLLLNSSLPSDIQYIHRDVYKALDEILHMVLEINGLMDNLSRNPEPTSIQQVRAKLLDLYGLRLNIEDKLYSYRDSLLKYVKPGEKTYYKRLLDSELTAFLGFIDDYILEAGRRLREFESLGGGGALNIMLPAIPSEVLVGGNVSLPVRIGWLGNASFSNLSVVLRLSVGWRTIREYSFNLSFSDKFTLNFSIPTADELAGYGVNIPKREPLRVLGVITVYGISNNALEMLGGGFFWMNVTALKPPLVIHVPTLNYLGEDIVIGFNSELDTLVNVSVLIDGSSYGYVLVPPGYSSYVIPSWNISKGYHTIVFNILPSGVYRGYRYSASMAVVGKPISSKIVYPNSFVWPLTRFRLVGEVTNNLSQPLYVWIYRGDDLVGKYRVGNKFSLGVEFQPPLFISIDHIRVLVGPDDPHYDPYVLEADIISVDLVGLLGFALVGLLGVYIGVSYEREIIIRGLEARLRRLRRRFVEEPGLSRFREVVVGFRESLVAKLYWGFINRFIDVFTAPYGYETLREYMGRVLDRLGLGVRDSFREATLLVERDLYSRERVDESLVRRLLRRVRDGLR